MKKKLLIIAVVLILLFLLTWRFSLVEHADPLPDWAARGMDRITGGRAYAEAEGLARGDTGEDVKELQERLNELGFSRDTADGVFGERTESAVRALRSYLESIRQEELRARADRLARDLEARRQALTPEYTGARARRVNRMQNTLQAMREALEPQRTENEPREESAMERALKPTFQPDGRADAALQNALAEGEVPAWRINLEKGMEGAEVERLQNRLYALNYLLSEPDGRYGADTALAVRAFEKMNGLSMDDAAGKDVQTLLFSGEAKAGVRPAKPFQLKVSTGKQRVYAYRWSVLDQGYTELERTMVCSTGLADTPTPKGTFTGTAPVARWGYFPKFDCWAQYLYRINGSILFHSVLYDAANEDTVRWGSVSKLGSRASHGCVRLSVEDARWVFNHCPAGTSVTVY